MGGNRLKMPRCSLVCGLFYSLERRMGPPIESACNSKCWSRWLDLPDLLHALPASVGLLVGVWAAGTRCFYNMTLLWRPCTTTGRSASSNFSSSSFARPPFMSVKLYSVRDPLHNSGEDVADGSGWDARRLFAVNSWLLTRKTTQQTARARLITDRQELCRGALGEQVVENALSESWLV